MRRAVLLAGIFLGASGVRAQQEVVPMTFDQALQATLNSNETLQQAVLQKQEQKPNGKRFAPFVCRSYR